MNDIQTLDKIIMGHWPTRLTATQDCYYIPKLKTIFIIIAMTNTSEINNVIFSIGGVGAQTVPALARRVGGVSFAVFFQGLDLLQKYFFESSRNFHHYL